MHTITLLRQGRTKQKVSQKVTNESHEKDFLKWNEQISSHSELQEFRK